MSFVRALARRVLVNPQRIQAQLDIWQLYHLLYYFQQCGGKEVRVPRPKNVSFAKQYRAVYSAVTKQVVRNLQLLREAVDTTLNSTVSPHSNINGRSENGKTELLKLDALPFQLSIPDAPNSSNPVPGVRLEGHAVPGAVVCFFPGTVYLPPNLKHLPNFPDISRGNPYLMSRTDSSIIDASGYRMEEIQRNPFAVGHLMRHPPKGVLPNVMPFSYDVNPELPKELLPLIPNKYYRKPGFLYSTRSPMRSLVFIAMKHIRDEELLLNYRLHPDSQLPTWYTSVDTEEDRRRWKY